MRPTGCESSIPTAPHDFPPDVRQQAYAFIDAALAHTPAPADGDFAAELPASRRRSRPRPSDFQILPGFRIEQVAAEPLVRSPVAIDFDENGRMFVVEMIDYSEQATEHLGTVRLLEDADGDGRFDKSTVYADKLSWPTAVLCYDGGVFVGAAPDIFYLKDTDGDGKADDPQDRLHRLRPAERAGAAQQLPLGPRQPRPRRDQHQRRAASRARTSPTHSPSTSAAATSPSTRARSTCAPRAAAGSTG